MSTPDFFAGAASLLDSEPLSVWQEWLALRVISAAAPYLSSAFVDANFAFYGTTLSGTPRNKDRWKRGVAVVEAALGEAVGQIYVARHFPETHKARMESLVANLIEAYRESITGLDWMGEDTKHEALKKLDAFRAKIGYPDKWIDYSAVEIDPADLLGNVERAHNADVDRHLDEVGKPVDRNKWLMTPQTVNAYYHPMLNEIVFPGGDPAAAVLHRRRRRRRQLRRHRRRHRPRNRPRLRRPGLAVRRQRRCSATGGPRTTARPSRR